MIDAYSEVTLVRMDEIWFSFLELYNIIKIPINYSK